MSSESTTSTSGSTSGSTSASGSTESTSWFSNSALGKQWKSLTSSMSSSENTKYLYMFLVLVVCVVIAAIMYSRSVTPNTFISSRVNRM